MTVSRQAVAGIPGHGQMQERPRVRGAGSSDAFGVGDFERPSRPLEWHPDMAFRVEYLTGVKDPIRLIDNRTLALGLRS